MTRRRDFYRTAPSDAAYGELALLSSGNRFVNVDVIHGIYSSSTVTSKHHSVIHDCRLPSPTGSLHLFRRCSTCSFVVQIISSNWCRSIFSWAKTRERSSQSSLSSQQAEERQTESVEGTHVPVGSHASLIIGWKMRCLFLPLALSFAECERIDTS